VANFFISKYLKHILSAWNGFRSTRLEFSISKTEMDIPQPIWIFFCTLNFSLDVHLLIPVTNKSCRHSPKLFARKIFLSISHVRLIVAKLNFAASLANLGFGLLSESFCGQIDMSVTWTHIKMKFDTRRWPSSQG